jgi:hypothetical protein
MPGIDPGQARLTTITRSFGWPNASAPFGDGLRFAGRFNVAEPHDRLVIALASFGSNKAATFAISASARRCPRVVVARAVNLWNGPHSTRLGVKSEDF